VPSRRGLAVLFLLDLMEMLAVYSVLIGINLLGATPLGYAMFWLLVLSAVAGTAAGLMVAAYHPPQPWDRVALVTSAAAVVGVLALVSSHGRRTTSRYSTASPTGWASSLSASSSSWPEASWTSTSSPSCWPSSASPTS